MGMVFVYELINPVVLARYQKVLSSPLVAGSVPAAQIARGTVPKNPRFYFIEQTGCFKFFTEQEPKRSIIQNEDAANTRAVEFFNSVNRAAKDFRSERKQ